MAGKTNKNYYGQKAAGEVKDHMPVKVTDETSVKCVTN
jgi:hypothetical protein